MGSLLRIVLGMAEHPIRLRDHEGHPVTGPRPGDRLGRRIVHLEHIVAVHGHGRDSIGSRYVGPVLYRGHRRARSSERPAIVFEHDHDGEIQSGGHGETFVGRACAAGSVALEGEAYVRLSPGAKAERHTIQDAQLSAERADRPQDAKLGNREVIGVVLPGAQRAAARGVLSQDVTWLYSSGQKGPEVPDRRCDPVAIGQGVATPYRRGLLPEAPVQPPDHVSLLEYGLQPLLQGSCEPEEAIQGAHVLSIERLQMTILAGGFPDPLAKVNRGAATGKWRDNGTLRDRKGCVAHDAGERVARGDLDRTPCGQLTAHVAESDGTEAR
jgi:hypothetical protein